MILNTLLTKLGVNSYEELTTEERETYRQWSQALIGRKLTDEDVAQFFELQIEDCLMKLTTKTLNDREDTFLKAKLDLIRQIKNFLDSPKREQEVITRQIQAQL
jgi:hypothetical protein